jgi:hypothetical protein
LVQPTASPSASPTYAREQGDATETQEPVSTEAPELTQSPASSDASPSPTATQGAKVVTAPTPTVMEELHTETASTDASPPASRPRRTLPWIAMGLIAVLLATMIVARLSRR